MEIAKRGIITSSSAHSAFKSARVAKTVARNFLRIFLLIVIFVSINLFQGACVAWADSDDAQDSSVSTGIQITTQDNMEHHYEAYKLFSDSLENGLIVNPSLQGCVPTSVYLKAGASQEDVASAEALAAWLVDAAANDSDGMFTVALAKAVLQAKADGGLNPAEAFSSGEVTALEAGYWLVISEDTQPMIVPVSEGEVLNAQEKATVPTPTKVVGQSDAEETGSWKKSSSAGVGDTVLYRLESTMPSNIAVFSSYRFWLCDELSDGLEYKEDSVSSRIVHADGTSEAIDLSVNIDGHKMRVGADDLLSVAPHIEATDIVVVEYYCTVVATASCGLSNGNGNTLSIEYQKSPTADAVKTVKATSVKAKAEICCFQIDLRLVDDDDKLLSGARFVIRNVDGAYRTASYDWSDNEADAQIVGTGEAGLSSFTGLGAGTYELIEMTPPEGYDPITEPIVVTFLVVDTPSANNTLKAQAYDESQVASVGNLTTMAHDDRTLTAEVSGSDARVVNVDAADGVITVQVKGTVSNPSSKGDDASGTSSKKPAASVPATGDQLFPVGFGLFAVSIGFIAVGALMRRARGSERNDSSHVS